MQEGSRWKGDGLGKHYWRSMSFGCMVWLIGKWESLPGESMLQQGNNIGFNKMKQAATLPHNVCHFYDGNLQIESSLATRNIICQHIRQTFHHWTILFGANVRNMWRKKSPKTYVISVGASTDLREHRWRSFEKNEAAQQKTSCSLYWFTRLSLRTVTVNVW